MSKQTLDPPDPTPSGQDQDQEHSQEHSIVSIGAGGAASQHTLRNIGLIIRREYSYRIKTRSFIIMSVILLILVVGAAFAPTLVQYFSSRSVAKTQLVVVNQAGPIAGLDDHTLATYISAGLNGTTPASQATFAVSTQPASALNSLKTQVKQGNLDILLVLARASNQALTFTYDTDADSINDTNLPTIQALAQQISAYDAAYRLGLTPAQISSLFAPPVVTATYSRGTRPVNQLIANYILAYFGAILTFIAVSTYAGVVAAGVAEEKGSRIMEILINAATPFQLMAGKVLGIGLACLTQMGGVVVVGIAALLLQMPIQAALFGANAGGFIQYLTGVSIPFYLLFLVYFLLAFFLYATLYAGFGALVRRQDEVQSAIIGPMIFMLSGYLLFFVAVSTPDGSLAQVLSYVPFWTPWMMMVRLALGQVAWWEVPVTIGLMLLTILACTWFAGRLYRLGVLMYGKRPGIEQLVKLIQTN